MLRATPSFAHLIFGVGSPDALHVRVSFCPTLTSDSNTGAFVILGGAGNKGRVCVIHIMEFDVPFNQAVINKQKIRLAARHLGHRN